MARVVGKFEVELKEPIFVSPDLNQDSGLQAEITVQSTSVRLCPRELKHAVVVDVGDGYEVIDEAQLLSLILWVTKDGLKLSGSSSNPKISAVEAKKFEPVISETVSRFVSAVKKRTNQTIFAYRNPIGRYYADFFHQDARLSEEPEPMEKWKIPGEYSTSRPASFLPEDFYSELSSDDWQAIAKEIRQDVQLPFYEEAVSEAQFLYHGKRFTAAFAFAVFSAESVIRELSRRYLSIKGGLNNKQIKNLLYRSDMPQLISFVESSYHIELPKFDNKPLRNLFTSRNDLVHGKEFSSSRRQALEALDVAEKLQRLARRLT